MDGSRLATRRRQLPCALIWLLGCSAFDEPAQRCDEPSGSFSASYEELEGTCGPLSDPFPIDVSRFVQFRPPSEPSAVSEVVATGCDVTIAQAVTDQQGRLLDRIDIDGRILDRGDSIEGVATRTRFSLEGDATCTSTYDVVLRQ